MSPAQTEQNSSVVCLRHPCWWQTPSQDLDLPGGSTVLDDYFPKNPLHTTRRLHLSHPSPTLQPNQVRTAYLPCTAKTYGKAWKPQCARTGKAGYLAREGSWLLPLFVGTAPEVCGHACRQQHSQMAQATNGLCRCEKRKPLGTIKMQFFCFSGEESGGSCGNQKLTTGTY